MSPTYQLIQYHNNGTIELLTKTIRFAVLFLDKNLCVLMLLTRSMREREVLLNSYLYSLSYLMFLMANAYEANDLLSHINLEYMQHHKTGRGCMVGRNE